MARKSEAAGVGSVQTQNDHYLAAMPSILRSHKPDD
jgi:hypothetical protein